MTTATALNLHRMYLDSLNGRGGDSTVIDFARFSGMDREDIDALLARHAELCVSIDCRTCPPPPSLAEPNIKGWGDFIGQAVAVRELKVRVASAVKRGAPAPPILLAGPGGTGKTTMARLVADQMGKELIVFTKPPANTDDMIEALWRHPHGVAFFDEVHLFTKRQQHDLMSLTEEPHVLRGRWNDAYFPDLTIVAATTEPGALVGPLLSRFECKPVWGTYTTDEMEDIILGMLSEMDAPITKELVHTLAAASADNPRQARALAVAARDLNLAEEDVTGPAVLALSRIQPDGLTSLHLDYLNALASQSGGSAGKEALTTLLSLAPQQIKVAEQVLVSRGLVMLTGSGRRITPAGRDRVAKGNLITWQ